MCLHAQGWTGVPPGSGRAKGDIDFGRVVGILRGAGYSGDLSVEDESLGKRPREERAGVLRKEIQLLKELR